MHTRCCGGNEVGKDEVFSFIWNLKCPNKITFLMWRTMKNRIPTKDNLRRKNIIIQQADLVCCICQHHCETLQYLFIECPVVWSVWIDCILWFAPNLSTIIPGSIECMLMLFSGMS